MSDPSRGPLDSRHWTDWAALAGYAVLGIALWWQSIDIAFMVLPVLLHELLIAWSFPRAVRGWGSWAAYLSTLLPLLLVRLAGSLRPEWLAATGDRALLTAGVGVWATGALMGLSTVRSLRRASNLESAAPIEQPPVYRTYVLTLAGLWLCHPTLPFAALLGTFLMPLAIRAGFPVHRARAAFPESAGSDPVDVLVPRLASLLAAREAVATDEVATRVDERPSASSPGALVASAEPAAGEQDPSDPLERPDQNGAGGSGEGPTAFGTDGETFAEPHHTGGNGTGGNGKGGSVPARDRSERPTMRRPRIDRIVPGLGRISVTPTVYCSSSCTVEVTSGGRRRRRHATDCEVASRSRTIDRLVECGQLDVLRAIKTGAVTVDQVHAAREAGELQN